MKKTTLIATAFFSLLGSSLASACALHTSSITGLQVSHPATITVSVATRNAMDLGTVNSLGTPGTEDKNRILTQIEKSFHAFGEIAEQQQVLGESFTVYLTESRLWTRFTGSETGWLVEHHRGGPESGDTILVLSDTALQGLFDSTLSVDKAKKLQLLVVDGIQETETTALQSFQQILSAYLQSESEHIGAASELHKHPGQS